jgi:hypothetical protein
MLCADIFRTGGAWEAVAELLYCRQQLVDRLLTRAMRTPYLHITSADGTDVYMYRYWLFNPYDNETRACKYPWLPSIRIHRIMRPDNDRHCHDHPWDARTIILRGWYEEERLIDDDFLQYFNHARYCTVTMFRHSGDTASLKFGEYHRIKSISPGGVLTLFITWKYQGTWGFLVDGKKVPHYEYRATIGAEE